MKILKALAAASLCLFVLAGHMSSGTTATVNMSLSAFCVMAITSSAVSLSVVNPAAPGAVPDNPTSSSTYAQYSSVVASGTTRRITAAWATGNSAPSGCSLKLTATPGSGQGSSAGQITLSTTAQNIVTGIGGCATGTGSTNGAQLGYVLTINSVFSLIAAESKSATITFTLTDS